MRAMYEFFNNDSEWEKAIIDTDDLENDSGEDWTEEMLVNYLKDTDSSVRNIEIQ